ncbi:Fibrillarin-like rRNA/tRNA 2'-O-methyltransferase [uncultured archaeon]|nr:Fibrillarin-like rRNA/tRNA 2'-O-methyltransferase [uncultured archaeon]
MSTLSEIFPGIYRLDGKLATKNFAPGTRVYGEKLVSARNVEYRMWDLFRSKLAGAIAKGLSHVPIAPGSLVLYLGASTGTTPSHVSDIVGEEGAVFAVEFAQRSMRDLMDVCAKRPNMMPIFGDARMPDEWGAALEGHQVDVLYQDVAQPDQDAILIRCAQKFLKPGGYAMLCIKSQSIDVTLPPAKVYEQVLKRLEAGGFETVQTLILDPYDKDHMFWMGKRK